MPADDPAPAPPSRPTPSPRAVRVGTGLGVCSAVAYTAANAALRHVSRPDDFDWSVWVTLTKAVPVAALAWVLLARAAAAGTAGGVAPARVWPRLLAVGVLGQIGGNLLFQEALGVLGLALTVPVCFTGIILTGAALGWLVLGEPVSARQGASVALLLAADVALALAAPDAAAAVAGPHADPAAVALAALEGLAAGCSYGILGVTIRRTAADGVGVAGTLAPIGTAGVLSLAAVLTLRSAGVAGAVGTAGGDAGWAVAGQTRPAQWAALAVAGGMNAAAFFAIAAALRRIDVVRVNLLNASQAAMAGVVGVLLFAEPPTAALLAGVALTVAGLAVLGLAPGRRGV